MSIRYRVQPVPNSPGKFYCQVNEEGAADPETAVRDIAQQTQQTEAVVTAVLEGAGQVIVESVLAGRGFYLPGIGKVTFSIEATLDAIDAPLPEDRRVRVRVALQKGLVDTINSQAQFERLAPENLSPIIQSVTIDNGVITALTQAAFITLHGSRLGFDPNIPGEGVFVQAPTGAPIAVAAAKVKSHTEGQIEFFWPTGLTANTTYTVFIRGGAKGSSLVRTSNSIGNFHNT